MRILVLCVLMCWGEKIDSGLSFSAYHRPVSDIVRTVFRGLDAEYETIQSLKR